MEKKSDLAKIALTAFILASSSPLMVHADMETSGVLLAAGGCGGGGGSSGSHACGSSSPNDGSAPANYMPYPNQPSGGMKDASYQTYPGSRSAAYPSQGSCGASTGNNNYQSANPNYQRTSANYSAQDPYSHQNAQSYYQSPNDYRQLADAHHTATASGQLSESQLLPSLNAQGRAIYLSLDPEHKALALQLASQDSYKDKNLAVKEAQRRMLDNPNFKPSNH